MNGFDYDVLVIGSGFGGSVTALRLTEKGYRVGVLEAAGDSMIPTIRCPGSGSEHCRRPRGGQASTCGRRRSV